MYDIVFISYGEPNAEANWERLKKRFPLAKRVKDVKGIHQAHIAAAKKCFTKMFWVVDGDAEILEDFNFDHEVSEYDLDVVHVWRSRNPINDLEYGYGGVKLLPRKMTLDMDVNTPDMTTSISTKFKAMEQVSNITAFNTDPFNTWKSAFRECVKLASRVIDGQVDEETEIRLMTWCTYADKRTFNDWAFLGAEDGKMYGMQKAGDMEALSKINDFEWLHEFFSRYPVSTTS
jgi:hypothetical protein